MHQSRQNENTCVSEWRHLPFSAPKKTESAVIGWRGCHSLQLGKRAVGPPGLEGSCFHGEGLSKSFVLTWVSCS